MPLYALIHQGVEKGGGEIGGDDKREGEMRGRGVTVWIQEGWEEYVVCENVRLGRQERGEMKRGRWGVDWKWERFLCTKCLPCEENRRNTPVKRTFQSGERRECVEVHSQPFPTTLNAEASGTLRNASTGTGIPPAKSQFQTRHSGVRSPGKLPLRPVRSAVAARCHCGLVVSDLLPSWQCFRRLLPGSRNRPVDRRDRH